VIEITKLKNQEMIRELELNKYNKL